MGTEPTTPVRPSTGSAVPDAPATLLESMDAAVYPLRALELADVIDLAPLRSG
jgi:hypothetical protein